MGLFDRLVVVAAKFVSLFARLTGLGAGETWPGEIALTLRPDIAASFARSLPDGVILIAGTNGKTTTTLMAKTILEHIGDTVVHNASGANLLNGIVSSCIRHSDWLGRLTADVGIFEVDENSLPVVLRYMKPKRLVLLNLFRDQLDRYGEVDVIVEKWEKALEGEGSRKSIKSVKSKVYKVRKVESRKSIKSIKSKEATVILNADDPAIASVGTTNSIFFGLNDRTQFLSTKEHAMDSAFCPKCGNRLTYDGVYYSHIGVWRCEKCGNTRPKPTVDTCPRTLPGLYNQYNTLAAVALAKSLDIPDNVIKSALKHFSPAFGRQEEIVVGSRTVKLFLSKNPAGFNASLKTALEMGARDFLFVLNDRIPDGRDVSWIWDVDFEMIPNHIRMTVSGDRVYDMALRIKYADNSQKSIKSKVESDESNVRNGERRNVILEPNLSKAIPAALERMRNHQTLFVLATYSAMLEARKILKGRKIL